MAANDPPSERKPFYGPTPSKKGEQADDTYELAPADEHVLAHEQARGKARVEAIERAADRKVDVNAIYNHMESTEAFDDALDRAQAQFSIRHLLIGTTIVALLLGLWRMGMFGGSSFSALIVLALFALGATHAYLNWQERRRQELLIAEHHDKLLRAKEEDDFAEDDPPGPKQAPSVESPWTALRSAIFPPLRFRAGQFLAALPVAMLVAGMLYLQGDVILAFQSLGVIALIVLSIQAADVEVPLWPKLTWWLALVAYGLALTVGIFL